MTLCEAQAGEGSWGAQLVLRADDSAPPWEPSLMRGPSDDRLQERAGRRGTEADGPQTL